MENKKQVDSDTYLVDPDQLSIDSPEIFDEWEACKDCKIIIEGYHYADDACIDCPVLTNEQRKQNIKHREYIIEHGLVERDI